MADYFSRECTFGSLDSFSLSLYMTFHIDVSLVPAEFQARFSDLLRPFPPNKPSPR